ncbi:EamA-like transporter family protein [Roseomonas rosea]|uniref:EamA-like transporter family protein n=1 Tax=Muricoccus roseus TaxID=198092 RepID=A0A1M6B2Y0_9PROT|nr:DMT family transporter [Roseomonas rosea]SHI42958.1 EamA-like transporter family protein [Roseomonas rosea]
MTAGRDRLHGLAWAVVTVTVAAAYPAITRLGVTQQAMTPMELATLRYVVAGLVLFPVLLASWRRFGRADWAEACILALCQGTPLAALIATGLSYAPASHGAALTLGLMPAATLVFAMAAGRYPSRAAAFGAAVIAFGAVALSLLEIGGGGSALIGHAMFVLAALMGATYFTRLRASGFTALEGAAFVAVLSGAGGVLALAVMGDLPQMLRIAPRTLLLQAVFQGLLVGVLTMVAMNRAIALLGAAQATVCMSLVPAGAAALAVPVLGEVPSGPEMLAIGTMVVGAILSALPGSPAAVGPFRCLVPPRRGMPAASPGGLP